MQFLAKCVCAKLSVSYIESNRLTLELFDCCISNKCHRVGCVSVQEARGVFASWELYHLMHKDENVSGFDAAVLIVVTWPVAKNVYDSSSLVLHYWCRHGRRHGCRQVLDVEIHIMLTVAAMWTQAYVSFCINNVFFRKLHCPTWASLFSVWQWQISHEEQFRSN